MMRCFLFAGCLSFALLSLSSCKKAVEQKKQDALVDAMTASTWYIGQYLEGSNILTGDFDGYDFNFKSDYTVVASKAGVNLSGSWTADVNTKVLTANFTSGLPLSRLNGTWAIYYQDSFGPKMNQFVGGTELKCVLKMR
ncbi:MAG: hypothetical protein ABIX01_18190 [Chitinophagaceae bacterium]